MSKSLIERLRDHLSCYWKEGDVAPQLTSIELMLIEEAATELAAAQAERDKAVAALKHYGQHVDGCMDNDSVDCICGYTTALKECGK